MAWHIWNAGCHLDHCTQQAQDSEKRYKLWLVLRRMCSSASLVEVDEKNWQPPVTATLLLLLLLLLSSSWSGRWSFGVKLMKPEIVLIVHVERRLTNMIILLLLLLLLLGGGLLEQGTHLMWVTFTCITDHHNSTVTIRRAVRLCSFISVPELALSAVYFGTDMRTDSVLNTLLL